MPSANRNLTFQELILRLQSFWAERGCVLQQPYDVEVGAGTMAPETFLRVLGPKPYKVAYVQPSRRPADGRYGENPNRLYQHSQLQVILNPQSGKVVTYGDVRLPEELQLSVYNFERADVEKTWKHLELYETECKAMIQDFGLITAGKLKPQDIVIVKRFPLLAAFDLCLKCSHLFNILDSRGAISVTERVGVIARIRNLAVGLAKSYLVQQNIAATSAENPAAAD